jgi:hypothetical protein
MKEGIMKGLIIRSPWIEKILKGEKTWELRGSNTRIRGKIALIGGGTKAIFGVCELTDAKGPLSVDELLASVHLHCLEKGELENGLPYRKTYAWVLENPLAFTRPVPYGHPRGAVIWVNLSPEESRQVAETEKNENCG